MNKIPDENWQAHMLRALTEETETIWVPAWLAGVFRWIGRIFGGVGVLALFCAIPYLAFEIAAALLGL